MTAEQLIALLDELQRRLDGPGRYIFDLAVRQVIIEGALPWIWASFFGLIGLAFAFVSARFARRVPQSAWDAESIGATHNSKREMDLVFSTAIMALFFVAVAVLGAIAGLFSLPKLLNPEWAALARIIETVKP